MCKKIIALLTLSDYHSQRYFKSHKSKILRPFLNILITSIFRGKGPMYQNFQPENIYAIDKQILLYSARILLSLFISPLQSTKELPKLPWELKVPPSMEVRDLIIYLLPSLFTFYNLFIKNVPLE